MICDFCGKPYVDCWYPCQEFEVNALAFHESGRVEGPVTLLGTNDDMTRWGACHTCSLYIDRKDYFFLAQRISRERETPEMFGPILNLFWEFDRQRNGEKQLI